MASAQESLCLNWMYRFLLWSNMLKVGVTIDEVKTVSVLKSRLKVDGRSVKNCFTSPSNKDA
jgi:hypothetical protein